MRWIILKRALPFVVLIFIGFFSLFSSFNCLTYLFQAGKGQLQIMRNQEPILSILADPKIDLEIKNKLKHVQEIHKYAIENLSLTPGKSYTTYVKIDREAVAWNVTACRELSFEEKKWWFPVVGTVPYLGFFNKEDAVVLENSLKKEGWETQLRSISAYSTLGWFNDPIFSTQMKHSEWYLTRLLIHEAAHSTLWFPGDVQFNESFASFVEETGSLSYYKEKEGLQSNSYKNKVKYLKEIMRLNTIFTKYTETLEEMYKSDISLSLKRTRKIEIIENLRQELKRASGSFEIIQLNQYDKFQFNNAFFLSFRRYNSGTLFFQNIFLESEGSWKIFLSKMKKLEKMKPEERNKLLKTADQIVTNF